jgi:hypothetical protein
MEYVRNLKSVSSEWDYLTHPLEIYLHSLRYKYNDRVFECEEPYWAKLNPKN